MPESLRIVLEFLVYGFVLLLAALSLLILVFYIQDRLQTKHAVRHNFPVIGRLRYLFESFGEFFRQYFIALDREEMPFNRAQRSWVYRAAKNLDNTAAFGSTVDLRLPGTIYFTNSLYPLLDAETSVAPITIGPLAAKPYTTASFFHISAMSYGAISVPAIQALANGARQANIWLNTGEGGLTEYHLAANCDLIFQIGTAKFGVRDSQGQLSEKRLRKVASHASVKMIEIKLSQGAKPGKGGILPSEKVTEEIAAIRGIEVGQSAISPNRFSEISSSDELLDFIERVRTISGRPTGIKVCIGNYQEIEQLFTAILNRGESCAPDFITIDSGDGGTGAAPLSLIDNMGAPIEESLPLVVDLLNRFKLRDRIKVIASGKLLNPVDIAWALSAGADFVNSARGFMFSLGCIQAMRCNKNTCPTGITTHDKRLQTGLDPIDKASRVGHYALNMHKEVNIIARSCGVSDPRLLKREHMRFITDNGMAVNYTELYPG